MKQLGEVIVSPNLSNQHIKNYRLASRGIIFNDNKLLMIYSKYYNDYTFPGGGVEKGEDEQDALLRECEEEAGVIIENIRPFVLTVEKQGLDDDNYLIHESHYYLCDMKKICKQKLENYEIAFGYQPIWITIEEAILYNEKKLVGLTEYDYKGVIERELRVLRYLKSEI